MPTVGECLARLMDASVQAVHVDIRGTIHREAPKPAALLCGSFNPLHQGHRRLASAASTKLNQPVEFELAVCNVDKPALTVTELEARLAAFCGVSPVWLTKAAAFHEKCRLFPDVVWVVGYDTASRILDPKYYGGTEIERDCHLDWIRSQGGRFLVAGRQNALGRFANWTELPIPTSLAALFSGLDETEFREDVSSSAIRQQSFSRMSLPVE